MMTDRWVPESSDFGVQGRRSEGQVFSRLVCRSQREQVCKLREASGDEYVEDAERG